MLLLLFFISLFWLIHRLFFFFISLIFPLSSFLIFFFFRFTFEGAEGDTAGDLFFFFLIAFFLLFSFLFSLFSFLFSLSSLFSFPLSLFLFLFSSSHFSCLGPPKSWKLGGGMYSLQYDTPDGKKLSIKVRGRKGRKREEMFFSCLFFLTFKNPIYMLQYRLWKWEKSLFSIAKLEKMEPSPPSMSLLQNTFLQTI